MFKAEIDCKVDAGHFLKLTYPSKCTNQHGHCWKIKVYLASQKLNENGMIIDFTAIKKVVNEFDHVNLNKLDMFKSLNPTAENMAVVLSREIQNALDLEMNRPLCYRIDVWETEHNMVTWEREE
jgi:6-pyruvoyltetrahydropterin/6-carboxytetrahydropterin synthase